MNDPAFALPGLDVPRETCQRIERFATSEQVHERWMELHKSFENEGWWGPATQDGRG